MENLTEVCEMKKFLFLVEDVANVQLQLSENLRGNCPNCGNPLTGSHCDTCCG